MNTSIYLVIAICIIACCYLIVRLCRKNKRGDKHDIGGILQEYMGLITSLVNSAVEIVKIDKEELTIEEYKNQIAVLVSKDLFDELSSEDMDNQLVKELIKAKIINTSSLCTAILSIFDICDNVSSVITKKFDASKEQLQIEKEQ